MSCWLTVSKSSHILSHKGFLTSLEAGLDETSHLVPSFLQQGGTTWSFLEGPNFPRSALGSWKWQARALSAGQADSAVV